MSLIKNLQKALDNLDKIATAVSTADTVAHDVETTVANPNVSTGEKIATAAVQVAETVAPAVITAATGSPSIVKILTAVQQLVLVVEEVKTDLKRDAPNLWAEIESAFPSVAK